MTTIRSRAKLLASLLLLAAGGDDDTATVDSTPASGTSDSAAGVAAGGMDHSMNRVSAKDADHEFLRMMSDHHQGLIQMASTAMTSGSTPTVQGDAHRLHTKQQEEQKRMLGMVQSNYGETVTPMVMGSNRTMLDQLGAKSGTDYDRAFYANVVAHHREGIRLIDDFLGRLTNSEVRQMAEMMKTDQQKEIAEFEPKARG